MIAIGKQIDDRLDQIKSQSYAIDINYIPKFSTVNIHNSSFSNCTGGKIETNQKFI